jgi:DNA adenine methylase
MGKTKIINLFSTNKKGLQLMKIKPIIPWISGKRRLAKQLLSLFPKHACYIEPFCGAAALYFLKSPSKVEVINDINGELINLYRVIQNHLEEFVRQFKWTLTSRQVYKWLQDTPTHTLTDVQRATRFYYLQKLSFGGKVEGQTFGIATTSPPRLNLLRIEEDLSSAHLRFCRTNIEHLNWAECIERYDRPHSFFYIDPPYWGTEGYGVNFGLEQYEHIAKLAKSIKGKMLISLNDIPEMREIFSDLNITTTEIQYTLSGGKRSNNKSQELIIKNW